jgi:hypothetical protein
MMEDFDKIIRGLISGPAETGSEYKDRIRDLAEEIGRQIVKILIESGLIDQR